MTSTAFYTNSNRSAQPSAGAINIGYNERMAGAIGGPLLALYGLTRGTPAGFVLAAGGGYLLYRSLAGRCSIYQRLGITTARGANEPLSPRLLWVSISWNVTTNFEPGNTFTGRWPRSLPS